MLDQNFLPLEPVGSSLENLKAMPAEVRKRFGGALRMAQRGVRPEGATAFGEGLPREVKKFIVRVDGETYRMAFTWTLPGAIYLLDVIHKKSKSGRATPKEDRQRIRSRWTTAKAHHQHYYVE